SRINAGVLTDRNHHTVGRNRDGLSVGPGACRIWSVAHFVEMPVGYDQISCRCRNDKTDSRFGRGMIEAGNPMMYSVGPVVSSRRRPAVLVGREYQPVFGLAVILDCNEMTAA